MLTSSLDVEIHHLETATPLAFSKVSVVEYGPLRGTVKAQVQYGKSSIDVTVIQVCILCLNYADKVSDFP